MAIADDVLKDIRSVKFDRFGESNNTDNFIVDNEFTVQITLNEYRSLVTSKATSSQSIDAEKKKAYDLEKEVKELKDEINKLTLANAELKAKLYESTIPNKEMVADEDCCESEG